MHSEVAHSAEIRPAKVAHLLRQRRALPRANAAGARALRCRRGRGCGRHRVPVLVQRVAGHAGARVAERHGCGAAALVLARNLGPEEFEQLRVPRPRVLGPCFDADGAALQARDGFVDHCADGAVFITRYYPCAARAVQEDTCMHEVEEVLERHEAKAGLGVDEVIDGGQDGLCGIESFVDEACVTNGADVVDKDALGRLRSKGACRVLGVGGVVCRRESTQHSCLEGKGVV